MFSTPKRKGDLFLASSLRDGVEDRNLQQVIILLENQGADPNILLPTHGITSFHLAVGNECSKFAEDVTKLFLQYGGNPNIKSEDGLTPVHVAAAWGRAKILQFLLDNGGDPLCLDDDGKSPFHHAFDGSHYDAIAVLGKYCQRIQEDENEDDDAKIKISLEKILVNRGDVIAEYLPSEIDLTDENNIFEEEQKNDIYKYKSNLEKEKLFSKNRVTDEKNEMTNSEDKRTKSESEKINSDDDNSHLNIHSNNVTLRRHRNHLSKKSTPSNGLNNRSEISLPTNKFHESSKYPIDLDNNSVIKSTNINTKSKKFNSLLSQPKSFKNNLEFNDNDSPRQIFNDSIVSKSPNFNIVNLREKKVETPPKNHYRSTKNITPKNLYENFSFSPKIEDKETNESNRTPIKMTFKKSNGETQYTIVNEELPVENMKKELDKDLGSLIEQSTQNGSQIVEENKNEFTDLFNKNIQLEDEVAISQSNSMNEIEACHNGLFIVSDSEKSSQSLLTWGSQIAKEERNDLNNSLDSEQNKNVPHSNSSESSKYFSNNPIFRNFGWLSREDMINSIDEERFYKLKGPTPPASVSGFLDDSRNYSQKNPYEGLNDALSMQWDIFNPKEAEILPNDFDDFREPKRSRCGTETSFFSLDEEYAYVDEEKKVAFLERRLRVLPPNRADLVNMALDESTWFDHFENSFLGLNKPKQSFSLSLDKLSIDDITLRQRLIELGEAPGPITQTTKYVYLKRLCKLEHTLNQLDKLNIHETENINEPDERLKLHSLRQIPKELKSYDFVDNQQFYRDHENQAFTEFDRPDPKRKYRGGVAKTSFNYLLLDSRITNDLPRNGDSFSPAERWKKFLEGIFYVGKGKAARPAAHLYDAFEIWTGNKNVDGTSQKIKKIIDIWKTGKGVVCLHVFMNTMQEEAFTREAAMIDALGTDYLSNCNRGNYYGIVSTMKFSEKKALGKFLLYKAMQIFMHEGERQLFPKSVE